jgi:MtrB/PioB family decaheme-associated outer membrane protein
MKMTNTRSILVLSSGCLLAVLGQAQEPEDEGGFSFSEDAFSMEPAAPPPPIYDSFAEGGIGYNSDDSFRFGRYNGLTDAGAFFHGRFRYLQRGQWDGEDLTFVEARGEDLGLRNRSLQGEAGVQGSYKLFLHYDELPYHDFTGRTPFEPTGSSLLTLPFNWQSNPQQDFNSATRSLPDLASNLREVDIETKRTRYGGGIQWNIDRNWTARVSTAREQKDGLKPIGVAWGTTGQNAAAVVVPQPVDYRTDRVDAELGFRDRRMQFNLAYQFSQFSNRDDTLRVQNPFTYAGWPPASYPNGTAELDLPPDNKAHSFTLSGGYKVTDTTRLTGNLGYSRYLQDDSLLPYTANSLLRVTQGLPRGSADAKVNNFTGNLELYSRPTRELDYKLHYRYTDRDNETPRDRYIYVAGDAENQQVGGTEWSYRYNTPYSFTEHRLGGDLGYRLQRHTKLSLGYQYLNTDRTWSERTENDEHKGSIGIRHRFSDGLSGSAEYARTWRSGSSYDGSSTLLDSYSQTYVSSLGDAAFINHPRLRMYHLADLIRDKASARLTYAANDALTLGGRLSYNRDDYDESSLGLTSVEGWGLSLDASYRFNEDLTLNGFYAYDDRKTDQAGWSFEGNANQLAHSLDPERRWWVTNQYRIHTFGAGLDWRVAPKVRLSADYAYTDAETRIDTRVGSALDTGNFPDVTSRTHSLRSELGYDLSEQTTLGLSYIYERYDASDWQTDDVRADTLGRVLSLETSDPDYDNHVILAWARFAF